MAPGKARQILFRIFYSTSFTAVFILLVIFAAITPADTIYESYKRSRLIDIFLIAGVYVFTALVAALIYASRIYTNRSVLKDIPKTFMPIEKEDLPGRRVHRLIQDCLERSAVIAYQARPRSKRIEHDTINAGLRMLALTKTKSSTDQMIEPGWGKIAHNGWSSPASKELPGLEYATVVDELVDLVEAKAVSLAPIDPLLEPGSDGVPTPDPRVIEEIARSGSMGMRTYLRHLISIGVVPDNSLTVAFLTAYERARFSSDPLSDEDFQALMRMFAELLRNMNPVEIDLLELDVDEYSEDQSYDQSGSHSETSSLLHRKPSSRSQHSINDAASIPSTYSASGSVQHNQPGPPRRISEDSAPSLSSYDDVLPPPPNPGLGLAVNGGDHSPTDATEGDAQSLYTAPTTSTTPRPLSRPRPPLRTSTTNPRMYSALSRQPSHPSDSGSLHSETGSVVHYEPQPQESRHSSRSSQSPRSRGRRDRSTNRPGVGVIRLTRDGQQGGQKGSDSRLPYQINVPHRDSLG